MIGIGALVAAATTLALCPPLIRELRRRVVIDTPKERSSHSVPTPRGGGIAPFLGACVGVLVAVGTSSSTLLVVVAVASAFGILGLVDDITTISVGRRLLGQLIIAAAGIVPLASDVASGYALVMLLPLGVLWLVAYVNAFNFMDGINGISVAQVVVGGGAWMLVGLWQDEPVLTAGALVVAAAALAFLPFNYPRARVFLGDVGSYFFGGWLAAMAVVSLGGGSTPEMAVAPLLLYLCDTGVTLIRRVARRERWTEAHKEHTYQCLVVGGWSHTRTTAFIGLLIALSSLLGAATMLDNVGVRIAADFVLALLILGYLTSPSRQGRRGRVETIGAIMDGP